MKKSTLIGLICSAVAFVAILLVATFFDLKINIALGNADSIFGQYGRMWGEFFGWVLIPIGAMILFAAADKTSKLGIALKVIWSVVTLVGWYLTVDYVLDQFTGHSYIEGIYSSPYRAIILYSITIAIVLTAWSLWSISKVKQETLSKLVLFAGAMLIALALSQLCCEVLKRVWTRQRFRNLDIGNGGTSSEGFTPWYKPNFGKNKSAMTYYVEDSAGMKLSDAYKSFPSGHTSGAAMTFIIIMLPDLFERLKKYKVWFYVVPILITVAVGISRIVNRAHYLSDTLFGGTIGAGCVFAARAIIYAIHKATKKNPKLARFSAICGAGGIIEEPTEEPAVIEETPVEEAQVESAPVEENNEENKTEE